jgi:hypothetical protein
MRLVFIFASALTFFICFARESSDKLPQYGVLPGITQDSLTIYPVVADKKFDTSSFITLDEGIQSGSVVVQELAQDAGLVRPRLDPGVWRERPWPPIPNSGPRVNQLALINRSDRALILLAGEIVTGGKQDRVVGRDRIVPAHSDPVPLDVFCVEPHRWMGASAEFGGTASAIAQPSVRMKAMADQNQQEVWDEVAKSRSRFAATVPASQAGEIASSSSYAAALRNEAVSARLSEIAVPIEKSYEKLLPELRAQNAVGVVAAVNGRILWADVFASQSLLGKYWPKLIRSYAAEALGPHPSPFKDGGASQASAQDFLNRLYGNRENVTTEPGIYSNSQVEGPDYDLFMLTSLLPNTGFRVHIAKMRLEPKF